MIFSAYVDDSGSDRARGDHFVLAGFLAPAPRWVEFAKDWQAALDLLPTIKYFKIKEAVRLHDEFDSFSPEQRNERVRTMLGILQRYRLRGIVSTVPYELHEELVAGKMAPEYDNPYFAAFCDITLGLAVKRKYDATDDYLEFFFDQQSTLGRVADKWYWKFRDILPVEQQKHLAPNVRFEDDKQFLPLQAADTIAWSTRRILQDNCSGIDLPEDILQELRQGFPMVQRVEWNRDRLLYIINLFNQILPNVEEWKKAVSAGENPLSRIIDAGKVTQIKLNE